MVTCLLLPAMAFSLQSGTMHIHTEYHCVPLRVQSNKRGYINIVYRISLVEPISTLIQHTVLFQTTVVARIMWDIAGSTIQVFRAQPWCNITNLPFKGILCKLSLRKRIMSDYKNNHIKLLMRVHKTVLGHQQSKNCNRLSIILLNTLSLCVFCFCLLALWFVAVQILKATSTATNNSARKPKQREAVN